MALVMTVRHGTLLQIGEAIVEIRYARRGATQLVIKAPEAVRVARLPRPTNSPETT